MTALTIEEFDDYFRELHGYEPYSWQCRLAKRAANGNWPPAIDLPTGSGKTACIDIAIFALACQAGQDANERTAPRRVFFCVNRRVIVDEAHQRANRIAEAIRQAERNKANDKPVLREVAAALRILGGTTADDDTPPLDVLELRGGIYRDNRWARSVAQPTVICTTIDQLGSRLLFRGYGVSSSAAPIQAALIAYDSLILLDEAHISEPFRQTLERVQRYIDPQRWAERGIGVPSVCVVPMTATPPEGVKAVDVIRLDDGDRRNDTLNDRLIAHKHAKLLDVTDVADAAAKATAALAKVKPAAVGVIVNHVATAKDIYHKLRGQHPDAVVELVIGSMRPVDRDEQAKRLRTLIGPERPATSTQTSFIVATQCLEVGADYDFDALVTECASLDSLRQRFGRLNRAGRKDAEGKPVQAEAIILVAKSDVKPDDKLDTEEPLDPIYGNALARTWNWLKERRTDDVIDFGIDAFDELLKKHGDNGRIPYAFLAPSASLNAPVMLPAYLDFWCQTAPRPVPDPDVSLFLHGPQRGEPDVQVCWRADLGEGEDYLAPGQWVDVVALLPPTSAECMSVPISRLRRWLSDGAEHAADHGDLLGVAEDGEIGDDKKRKNGGRERVLKHRGVLWRGVKHSTLIRSPDDLRPGDTLVLPCSSGGWDVLGHLPHEASNDQQNPDPMWIDRAEAAFLTARSRIVLRIHPTLKSTWPKSPVIDRLFDRMADSDDPPTIAELVPMLRNAADAIGGNDKERADLLRELAKPSNMLREEYPDGRGAVLMTRRRLSNTALWLPVLDDGEDEPSRTRREKPVTLTDHCRHVEEAIARALLLMPAKEMADAFRLAASLHDMGKADERFQAMLTRTNRTDAWLVVGKNSILLAKSGGLALTRSQYVGVCKRAGLPKGFRHEMLSAQLAERCDQVPADSTARDLVLHFIATHHGYARPFAPVVPDDDPPEVEVQGMTLSRADRIDCPPHRLDSGIAERFWSLTRRFGWWGLAYLESIHRLADWQASADEEAEESDRAHANQPTEDHCMRRDMNLDQPNTDNGVPLPGLDGSNPLGFLAALGVLRMLSHERGRTPMRMKWVPSGSTWVPAVCTCSERPLDQDALLKALQRVLVDDIAKHPARLLKRLETGDVTVRRDVFRQEFDQAAHNARTPVDWLAAIASDFAPADAVNQLQTPRRDYYYDNLASVIRNTTVDHLRRSIFGLWDYGDGLDNQSLHLDPSEDRRHAHQWNQPSGDPARKRSGGMLGANRLAIEAIPLFTSFPEAGTLRTVGFTGSRSTNTRWTWPIWRVPLSLHSINSLLKLEDLQAETLGYQQQNKLHERGIVAVFRADRILVQKTHNFTPARRIA